MSNVMDTYKSLLQHLRAQNYIFICPSPETHARVVQNGGHAKTLEDFFGWNLKAERDTLSNLIPSNVFQNLQSISIISTASQDTLQSTVRISNLYLPDIPYVASDKVRLVYYIHGSFPLTNDSVFFGPDTYLFLSFLRAANVYIRKDPKSLVDVCCGSGAGAIHFAHTYPQAQSIGLDLNPRALEFGRVNAELAGTKVDFRISDLYTAVPDQLKTDGIDLIIANPPYIASNTTGNNLPTYADGKAVYGLEISIRILEEGIKLLSADGVLVIYTAVAILKAKPGHDMWLERLTGLPGTELMEYRIVHPDMWSEEIGKGAYIDAGRIQVVGAVLKRVGLQQDD